VKRKDKRDDMEFCKKVSRKLSLFFYFPRNFWIVFARSSISTGLLRKQSTFNSWIL